MLHGDLDAVKNRDYAEGVRWFQLRVDTTLSWNSRKKVETLKVLANALSPTLSALGNIIFLYYPGLCQPWAETRKRLRR